jgi:hypothetical protein
MNNIVSSDVPLYCETILDEKNVSISFCLSPEANSFLFEILKNGNQITKWLEQECGFSKFIPPQEDGWGFGKLFRPNDEKSVESGWTTWECLLPRKPDGHRLSEISSNIYQVALAMIIFGILDSRIYCPTC